MFKITNVPLWRVIAYIKAFENHWIALKISIGGFAP